jgi:hypothetical protein
MKLYIGDKSTRVVREVQISENAPEVSRMVNLIDSCNPQLISVVDDKGRIVPFGFFPAKTDAQLFKGNIICEVRTSNNVYHGRIISHENNKIMMITADRGELTYINNYISINTNSFMAFMEDNIRINDPGKYSVSYPCGKITWSPFLRLTLDDDIVSISVMGNIKNKTNMVPFLAELVLLYNGQRYEIGNRNLYDTTIAEIFGIKEKSKKIVHNKYVGYYFTSKYLLPLTTGDIYELDKDKREAYMSTGELHRHEDGYLFLTAVPSEGL